MCATRRASKKVLVLFSGPLARPDGIRAHLLKLGLRAELIDSDPDVGGGRNHWRLCMGLMR